MDGRMHGQPKNRMPLVADRWQRHKSWNTKRLQIFSTLLAESLISHRPFYPATWPHYKPKKNNQI